MQPPERTGKRSSQCFPLLAESRRTHCGPSVAILVQVVSLLILSDWWAWWLRLTCELVARKHSLASILRRRECALVRGYTQPNIRDTTFVQVLTVVGSSVKMIAAAFVAHRVPCMSLPVTSTTFDLTPPCMRSRCSCVKLSRGSYSITREPGKPSTTSPRTRCWQALTCNAGTDFALWRIWTTPLARAADFERCR